MGRKSNRKITKKEHFKRKMKLRRFRTLIILIGIIFGISFGSYKLFLFNKCKDLTYAVEHFMTSRGNDDLKLLRVQTMKLVYSDGETAVVEAYGMGKSEPHATTSIKGHYKKDSFDSWTLDDSYLIQN